MLPPIREPVSQLIDGPKIRGQVRNPSRTNSVLIRLVTPLAIRRGRGLAGTLDTLPVNIVNRVDDLARWQDARLDRTEPGLADRMRASSTVSSDLLPTGWQRRPSSGRESLMSARGLTGKVMLTGNLEPIREILAFGELFHAGGETALGLGQYELNWY